MTSCLVTGGAGFIGTHVARSLLDAGHEVVVLDDLSGGFRDNLDQRADFVQGSVCDRHAVNELFAQHRFERVFHLAAYAAEGLSHFIKRFNYENNVIGTMNLINAAVNFGTSCFVFTSSIAVYGGADPPMAEATRPAPEDSYGIAKYAVELELAATKRMFGLDYVIFRPHNVYGEYQNTGDRYRNVIGIFMNQIMRGEPLTVFGDGEQTRAFSYVGDIAPVIAHAPDEPLAACEIFNIGADSPCTVNQLADLIRRQFGAPDHAIVHLEERKEVRHAWCGHQKVEAVFGSRPSTGLESGIGRMAEWARKVGPRVCPRFADIEIRKSLPAAWRE